MSSSIEKAAQRLEQLRKAGTPLPSESAQVDAATVPSLAQYTVPEASSVAPNIEAEKAPIPRTSSKTVHIDLEALAAAGFVTPNAPRSATTDQFRVIKRPLLDNATGKGASVVPNGNLIMVTSSLPGEGKSFTAINLAMSLAMEMNYTVMLVDADVARPSIMKKLGLPPAPGLLDLLLDKKTELSDVLLRTNVENLTLLPTGLPHSRATELLASDAMTALLKDMGKRYGNRIIIFDSPPPVANDRSAGVGQPYGADCHGGASGEDAAIPGQACLVHHRSVPDPAYGPEPGAQPWHGLLWVWPRVWLRAR